MTYRPLESAVAHLLLASRGFTGHFVPLTSGCRPLTSAEHRKLQMKGVRPSAAQAPAHTHTYAHTHGHVRTPVPTSVNYTSVRDSCVDSKQWECVCKWIRRFMMLLRENCFGSCFSRERGNTVQVNQVKHDNFHTHFLYFNQRVVPSRQPQRPGEKKYLQTPPECSGSGGEDALAEGAAGNSGVSSRHRQPSYILPCSCRISCHVATPPLTRKDVLIISMMTRR